MLRSRFLLFAVLLSVLGFSAVAAADDKPVFKDAEYLAAVDAAFKDPAKGDWTKVRNLYSESSFYDDARRHGMDGSHFSDLGKKALQANTPEAIAAYKEDVRKYAGAIDTWAQAYALSTKDKAAFVDMALVNAAMKGLAEAMLTTGDGKSMKTAIHALSTTEEYFLMRSWYGLTPAGQALERGFGHMYDVDRLKNKKGEDVGDIFFDISLYYGRMEFPKELTDKLAAIAKEHPAPAVKPAPSPLPKEDQSYLDAVDAAMKDPKSANWDTVRALYPDTTFYKRVGGFNIAHHVAATANYVAKRMSPEAIEFYKKFQREHYASAGAHKTALQLHDRLKAEFIDAAAEKAAFDELMQSVSRTGDGKAPPTAFKVISLEEASEYVMTVMKSAPPPDLKIENADSRRYLVFRGSAVDTGAPLALYFTVDPRATLTPLPQENFPAVATLTVKQAGGNPPASGAQPRQFPDMRGYGGLPDLHDAIARDNQGEGNLLAQVQALSALTLTDIINAPESYDARVDDIIYRWAQTNKLVPNSRGPNVDARQLGVLEKVLNGKTAQLGAASGENPLFFAAIQLNQIYSNVHGHVLATLAIEGAAAKLFLGQVAYNPANDTIGGAQGLDAAKILELGDAIGRMDSSGKKKAAWKTIVGIIEHSIGVKSLSAEDSGALNAVIAKSDSTLSLSKVLAWVTTVDMSQLPGHDYANKSLGLSAADGDLLEVARKALAKDTGKQVVYSDIATEIMKSCCKTQAEVLSYLQDHSYEATLRDMEQSKKDFGSEMNYTSVVYAVWKPSSWQMFRAKYWDKEPLAFKMVIVFMNGDQVVWAYAHVQRS